METAKLEACILAVDLSVLPSAKLVLTYIGEQEQVDFKSEFVQGLYAGYKRRQRELEPTTSRPTVRHLNHSATTLFLYHSILYLLYY